jgi:hypothetical protein
MDESVGAGVRGGLGLLLSAKRVDRRSVLLRARAALTLA